MVGRGEEGAGGRLGESQGLRESTEVGQGSLRMSGSFNGFGSQSNLPESGEMGWRSGQMGEERSFYQYIPVMPNSWLPAFPLFPYSFPSLPSFLTEPQDPLAPPELGKTSNE